ncbi:MAG TPA: heavy metal translocating P-type ATPase [Thermoplasmata archaeon]|nr:heavy metal translocating P-type ATPase [Thermoplasmata archaeon]
MPGRSPVLRRIYRALRAYPVPSLALVGLLLGLYLTYAGNRPDWGRIAWYATLIAGGAPLVLGTLRRLLRREFASDIIATLAILGAIVLEQPFAGAIIVLMQSGGEAIEEYAHRRATASLDRLVQRAPRWAHRYRQGSLEKIPVDEVRPGDRLSVRTGDVLPVDGEIAGGTAIVDEAAVTGEPLPRTLGLGAPVLSGMVNVGPAFDLVAVRPSRESQYARIVALVRTAQTQKPAIQRLADRYATWFTPTTVVVALAAAFFDHSALTGLAVLVVATPCPLILATPIAVLRGIDRASDRGIVVKSGAALEEMGRARVVLFDKTGTLTSGRPEIDRVIPFGGVSPAEILRGAAAVEQFSSHPLAEAVTRGRKGSVLPPVEDHHEFPGSGVAGTVEGRRLVLGSRGLCEGVAHRSLDREWEQIRGSGPVEGRLASFLLVEGAPAGAILFKDALRSEVPGLTERLRQLGIRRTGLLTGDNPANAEDVAHQAGIQSFEADLLPEQKVERVGEYRRRYGSTVMVGDGINDAAALAAASVGIAMGAQGSGISAEAADAVLLVDDVGRVADGIELGQRMLRVARQGILFGLGASLVLMGIASFGYIAPADGAVVQEVLDVAVIFNALRVR